MFETAALVAAVEPLKAVFFRVSGAIFIIYPLIVMAQLMASGAMSSKVPTADQEPSSPEGCDEAAKRFVPPPSPKPKSPAPLAVHRLGSALRRRGRRSSAATVAVVVFAAAGAAALVGHSLGFLAATSSPAPTPMSGHGGHRTRAESSDPLEKELPVALDLNPLSPTATTAAGSSSRSWLPQAATGLLAASAAAVGLAAARRQSRKCSTGASSSPKGSRIPPAAIRGAGRILRCAMVSGHQGPAAAAPAVKLPQSAPRYYAPGPPELSLWHDVDLHVRDWLDWDTGLFRYVNEMPKGSLQKFEVQPHHEKNAISEDPKGSDRLAAFGQPVPFNYGCLPQTYRDPKKVCELQGVPGDDDPLDILDLGESTVGVGEVVQCRVLGAVCLIDEGQADWKILAVNTESGSALAEAKSVEDVERISPGRIQHCLKWMDDFKQSNSADSARLDFTIYDAATALKLIETDHSSWKQLVAKTGADGTSNGHWIRSPHPRPQALNIPIPKPPARAVPGKILSAPASLVGASREAVLLHAISQKRGATLPKEHRCQEEEPSPSFGRITSP